MNIQKKTAMNDVPNDKIRYVTDSILSYIINHQLRIDDKLPSEEELTNLLGVSRSSVREGLQSLKFQGLLESSTRRGTVLRPVDFASVGNILAYQIAISDVSFYQLLEARLTVELGALELIANKASLQEFAELRSLADCSRYDDTPEALEHNYQRDRAFHRRLLEISGNAILISFSRLLELFFSTGRCASCAASQEASREHLMVLDALESRNFDLARGLLKKHLNKYVGHS